MPNLKMTYVVCGVVWRRLLLPQALRIMMVEQKELKDLLVSEMADQRAASQKAQSEAEAAILALQKSLIAQQNDIKAQQVNTPQVHIYKTYNYRCFELFEGRGYEHNFPSLSYNLSQCSR